MSHLTSARRTPVVVRNHTDTADGMVALHLAVPALRLQANAQFVRLKEEDSAGHRGIELQHELVNKLLDKVCLPCVRLHRVGTFFGVNSRAGCFVL